MEHSIDAIVDETACCKASQGNLEEQVEWLKDELSKTQRNEQKLFRQSELLSMMYAEAVQRGKYQEENLLNLEHSLEKARRNCWQVQQVLFDSGKVRMSKETERTLRILLSF